MQTQTHHEFSDNCFDCVSVGILALLAGTSFGCLATSFGCLATILSGVL